MPAASPSTLNHLSYRSSTTADQLSSFSLGNAHHGGDALPFRRQTGKIVGDNGKIAIDRDGAAALCVSSRIFQCRGQFFLLSFQCGDFRLQFVHPVFFFAPRFGKRIARFRCQTFLFLLLF